MGSVYCQLPEPSKGTAKKQGVMACRRGFHQHLTCFFFSPQNNVDTKVTEMFFLPVMLRYFSPEWGIGFLLWTKWQWPTSNECVVQSITLTPSSLHSSHPSGSTVTFPSLNKKIIWRRKIHKFFNFPFHPFCFTLAQFRTSTIYLLGYLEHILK